MVSDKNRLGDGWQRRLCDGLAGQRGVLRVVGQPKGADLGGFMG